MPYLLYTVSKVPPAEALRFKGVLKGIKGQPVKLVTAAGLQVAVSQQACDQDAPSLADLLAYGEVVETLHQQLAVIPMRMGCVYDDIPSIRKLLRQKRTAFVKLLDDLEGHAEMGVRFVMPTTANGPSLPPPANGRAWLTARREYYQSHEMLSRDHKSMLDHCLKAFYNLYTRQRTERYVQNRAVITTFYFLVPRVQITAFKNVFDEQMQRHSLRALLSGPWPPYNFVTPARRCGTDVHTC